MGKLRRRENFPTKCAAVQKCIGGGKKEWNGRWMERSPHPRRDRQTDRQTEHMQLSQSRGPGSRERERERAGRRVYGKIMRGRSRHPSTTKGQLHNGCFFSEERGNGNGGHTRLIRRRRCTLWRAKDGGEGKKDSILPF